MKIEIRSKNEMRISGYVNAVERDSRVLPKAMAPDAPGDFVERIKAKTFERAIQKNPNVEIRFNHQKVIGFTADGSLKLHEDNIGLYAEATVRDEEVIREARNLKGWSFGFTALHDSWEDAGNGIQRRNVDEIDIKEVSILTLTPAYIGTSIEMRGDSQTVQETRGMEDTSEVTEEPTPDFFRQKKEIEIMKIC